MVLERTVTPVFSSNAQTLLSDKFDIMHCWKQQFKSVLNTPAVTELEDLIAAIFQSSEIQEMSFGPTLQEVFKPIKQISSSIAPGKDAILPEIYKYGCKS